MVTVDSAGTIKHDRCLGTAGAVEAARKVPPIIPLQPKKLKKKRKAQKAEKVVPAEGTVEQALKRHEELMMFYQAHGQDGREQIGRRYLEGEVRADQQKSLGWLLATK